MAMRLAIALLCSFIGSSCSGNSREPARFVAPSAPTTITALSDPSSGDEPVGTRRGEIEEIHTAAAGTYVVSGVVTDKVYASWKISGATVTVTPGSRTTRTTLTGQYSIRLSAGTYTIKIAKSGYSAVTIRKTINRATTLNGALQPVKPSGATARCKDRTWSKSQKSLWHMLIAQRGRVLGVSGKAVSLTVG